MCHIRCGTRCHASHLRVTIRTLECGQNFFFKDEKFLVISLTFCLHQLSLGYSYILRHVKLEPQSLPEVSLGFCMYHIP